MIIFLILTSLLIQLNTQNYSTINASFHFQNGNFYNYMTTPSTIQYQNIILQSNNSLNISYNWYNTGVIRGSPTYTQTNYFPIRLDTNVPLNLQFSFSRNNNASFAIFFMFTIQTNNSLTSIGTSSYTLKIAYIYQNTTWIGTNFLNTTYLNRLYQIYNSSNNIKYVNTVAIQNCSLTNLDMNFFLQDLLQKNISNPNDYIVEFQTMFNIFYSNNTFIYYQNFSFNTYHHYDDSLITFSNLNVSLQLFNKNFTSLDYCNVTWLDGTTQLSDMTIDYYFGINSNNFKANVGIVIGYINNTWVTQVNANSLPLKVLSQSTIMSSYNLHHYDYNIFSQKIATCWIILIKNDYNPSSQTFSSNSSYPSREIYVCPYWTDATVINSNFVTQCYYNLTSMNEYIGNSNNSKTSWPSHTFLYNNKTLNPTQIDLMAFVRWIYITHNLTNTTDYVVGVEQSVRIYSGKGNFSFLSQSINISLVLNQLNVTINQSVSITNTTNTTNTTNITNTTNTTNTTNNTVTTNTTDLIKTSLTEPNIIFSNPAVQNLLLSIMSFPNWQLIFYQVIPILQTFDQFSYYPYHERNYSYKIQEFYNMANTLMNNQWIPSIANNFINEYYLKNINYNNKILQQDYNKSTQKLKIKGHDIYFLKNVKNYLVSSVPFTIIIFFFFLGLQKLFKKVFLGTFLKRFSSVWFLCIPIIGANIQYISFWAWTQFYYIVAVGNIKIMNLVATVLFLFIMLFYSISGNLIIKYFVGNKIKYVNKGKKNISLTLQYTSMILMMKFINGFIHSYLYYYGVFQIILLLLTHILYLIILIKYRSIFHWRTLFFSILLDYLIKIAMHILFFYEQLLLMKNQYTQDINIGLGTIELMMIYSIILINLIKTILYILLSIKQIINFDSCLKKNYKQQQPVNPFNKRIQAQKITSFKQICKITVFDNNNHTISVHETKEINQNSIYSNTKKFRSMFTKAKEKLKIRHRLKEKGNEVSQNLD